MGLRQMASAIMAAADGDEAATAALIEGAVCAEVKLKQFLARLGVTKGSTVKLSALLHEMEAATSKLATLAQRARTGHANSRDLALAQAELLRETLKDVLNECRRLRDAEPAPHASPARTVVEAAAGEPVGAAAARQLGVEASRFALWVRESDMSSRIPPQNEFVERARVLAALAKQLEGESEASKRLTAALVRAGQGTLYGPTKGSVQDAAAELEAELLRVRQRYGEQFVRVQQVGGQFNIDNEDDEAELAALESELDDKALSKWQKPFAHEHEYLVKQQEALARRDARLERVQVKRASSAAQVAAMKSSLRVQEESLAQQKRQLEELEKRLREEQAEAEQEAEREAAVAQQYPEAKQVGEYGLPSAGGFVVVRKTEKGAQLEKQKTLTNIRPALPQYK